MHHLPQLLVAPFLALALATAETAPEQLSLRSPNQPQKALKLPRLSDPTGAVVVFEFKGSMGGLAINGRKVCRNQPRCMGELSAGEYNIILSQEGYLDSTFKIQVPNSTNYYLTALTEKPGILILKAVEAKTGKSMEGRVVIDDKTVGTTPWTGPVASDAKFVGVRFPGYKEALVSGRPARRKELAVTATLTRTELNKMKKINDGCFKMGYDGGKEDERPIHEVCLSAFYMDQYEVTQDQFLTAMGQNPSFYSHCGKDCPVESVTWKQAAAYCDKQGKRLPTEAEWEYAARAGSGSKWGCGLMSTCLGNAAWYGGNSNGKTHPVGQKSSNSWDLYDMSGNVAEWTADWYGHTYYSFSAKQNPKGANGGDSRVVRGGSWEDKTDFMLISVRGGFDPSFRETSIGFRCAMDAPKE